LQSLLFFSNDVNHILDMYFGYSDASASFRLLKKAARPVFVVIVSQQGQRCSQRQINEAHEQDASEYVWY
jgi:hypothetical protein